MKKVKKYISLILCFVLLLTSVVINGAFEIKASETPVQTGVVDSSKVTSNLRVRDGAGTGYNVLGAISPGNSVSIYALVNGWYKIAYGSGYGYVSADYITNIKDIPKYDYNADFEANLTSQNFPESYKAQLRALHAAHPNWIFLADHLTMTFNEAVNNESTVGKSLVQDSVAKDSWKSMMQYAYDWSESKYVPYDTGGWVTAEREVVEYYMEPRNFLNENGIFMFLDQTYNPQVQTKEGLQLILNGTFMEGAFPEDTHATYADVIMDAAAQSGVNPYVLASMIIIEQGANGAGASISGTQPGYEGYYNFFNIRAYASGSYTAVAYGLIYAKGGEDGTGTSYGRPWNTRAKSIIGGAKYFANGYVKRGQDTLYYKKFNVITPTYYINQYMTNVQGAYHETLKLKNGYASVSPEAALTFSIPVYKDTSSSNTTTLPTSNGPNNYFITGLSVAGQKPENFNIYVNEYEFTVTSPTNVIRIEATYMDGASLKGMGDIPLNPGPNTVTLAVTAASGKVANYYLHIYLITDGSAPPPSSGPSIEGSYNMSTYVSGVAVGTDVSTFIKNFNVKNGTAKVCTTNYQEKTSGVICTGDKVLVYDKNGAKFADYTIVVFGDTNSDGKISIVDLGRVQKHLLELSKLGGAQGISADVNRDGKVSILDLARVQKHLLELTSIQQ
ncbi:MAG: SH3 domain-containing protein [Clostridia bacterium]|nr:SH3 domain-containing protein [Clostridia bacterium]